MSEPLDIEKELEDGRKPGNQTFFKDESKNLLINGRVIKRASTKIKVFDSIKFSLENKENNKLIPKKMNLNIIYEDKDILLINKPKGLVVHPGAGNYYDTLANGLAYKYRNKFSSAFGKCINYRYNF